jgi:hypothetical protein
VLQGLQIMMERLGPQVFLRNPDFGSLQSENRVPIEQTMRLEDHIDFLVKLVNIHN